VLSFFELLFTLAGAKRPDVIRFSLAMTMPSLARIPTQVPALLIASMAYSTYKVEDKERRSE
jgi:hypothetical protein